MMMRLQHHLNQLETGLKLLKIPMPAVASVTALVLGNTGSRYETPAEQGIAHFFEHMVFKGTAKYPTPEVLAAEIDALGAEFNAFTSKEYTGYYVKSASQHLPKTLDVLSDMLLAPKLRQADIDREKGVIIEELNMYHDMPSRYVGNLFERLMFEGSGLEHDIIGQKKTIKSLVTADFKRFLHQWYGLGNLVLVLAGDAKVVESEATIALVEDLFAKNSTGRSGQEVDSISWLAGHESDVLGKGRLVVDQRSTEQVHLNLGWPGLKQNDKRRYVLTLLGVLMGGNMSSRLFSEVREKRGLCYYVRADVDRFHDTGVFGASAGVDPSRFDEALKVIVGEFEQLASGQKKVTQRELDRARDFAIGSMILSLEDSQQVAQFFGLKQVLTGEVTSPDQAIANLKKVTVDQVQALVRELVQDLEMRLAVIGPVDEAKLRQYR